MKAAPWLLLGAVAAVAAARAGAADKVADEVTKHAQKIAALHHLPLKSPVKSLVVSQEKLLDRIKQLVFIDYTPQEIIDEGRMLVRLGMFPAGLDYGKTIFQLLEEQVIGLYDTDAQELLLVDYIPDVMEDTTADHEITHAVQDQNFNLKELMKKRDGEGDLKLALSAVFEGDALITEEVVLGDSLPEPLTAEGIETVMMGLSAKGSKVAKVPAAVRKSLFFPYTYGYIFMRKVFKKGGYDAVNAVLADPPKSTEQVLHPDAYAAGDDPVKVGFKLPSQVLASYRVATEDVMGEFSCRIWLEEFIDPLKASLACDGWEGDWFTFLWPSSASVGKEHLARGVFVMATRWDKSGKGGSEDAGEFVDALREAIKKRWKHEKVKDGETLVVYRNVFDEWVIVLRDGTKTLYIEGLPVSMAKDPAAFSEAILKTVM
jgi:hypothetical protein